MVVAAQIEMNSLEFSTIIGKMKDADVEEEIRGTEDSINIHQWNHTTSIHLLYLIIVCNHFSFAICRFVISADSADSGTR